MLDQARRSIRQFASSRCLKAGSLKSDIRGTTAIEFAIVATPFFMFIFAILGFAFYFFVLSSVEKGVDQATRLVRTGQAVSSKMTVNQFKQKICDASGNWIACGNLQVWAIAYDNWQALANPSNPANVNCVNGTNPSASPLNGSDLIAIYTGSASQVVVVTACYQWKFTKYLPFVHIGNMPDGSLMLQSVTAFRSEPYPTT